jgi:hypothetical protein
MQDEPSPISIHKDFLPSTAMPFLWKPLLTLDLYWLFFFGMRFQVESDGKGELAGYPRMLAAQPN